MSLLASVPGGSCLEPPINRSSRATISDEELRLKIVEGLLPAQKEFCIDREHRILGFIGGFGSGKTRALCARAVLLCMDNPKTVGAVFEPTFQLLKDVWMRSFDDYLEEYGIEHDFRISPQPEYIIHTEHGSTTLLCRATETWNRIRGQNLSFCLADEIDTSPPDVAQKASEMFLARLRGGKNPSLSVGSTPEGYKWCYRTFVENGDREDRRMIKAKTTDNPHLPDGFVESLYENFPPNLIASYIQGNFTNLENTTVYHPFDRDKHWTDTEIGEDERIFCGVDFNVGACFVIVIVRRGDEFHVVDELHPKDTPAVVEKLRETYSKQLDRENLVVIPDAASRQRTTTNAAESDLSLLKRGKLIVKAQPSNPLVADRVNCINVLLLANRLKVHNRCKYLIKSLEQQTYDKTGKPDKGIGGIDDISGPVDALGYGIHYLSPLRRWSSGGSTIRIY